MFRVAAILVFIFFSMLSISSTATAKGNAEVVHWWVSGSEGAALQTVVDRFEAAGYSWVDTPVKASYQAKSVAISRMLDGTPPTMIQWHAGIAIPELFEEGLIRDLSDLVAAERWDDAIPPVLMDQISFAGKVVAIPLTLHGSNWMWANKKVFDEIKEPLPQNWSAFLTIAPKLEKAGYIPLAVGAQPWQLRLLFNNVLLGVGGPELYRKVMIDHDPVAIESEKMVEIFTTFGKLRQFVDDNSQNRGWSETTKLVIDGKAAIQIMGDWAKGEFTQAGQLPEEDFLCTFSPGTANNYLIVTDVFVAPITTKNAEIEIQNALARVMMEQETQRLFNIIKGSIPPRTDVSTTGFDKCSTIAIEAVAGGATLIPGFKMTNKGIISNLLMDNISTFWNSSDTTPKKAATNLANAIRQAQF